MTRAPTHVYVVRFKGGHKIGSTIDVSARVTDLKYRGFGAVHLVRKWKLAQALAVEYAARTLLRDRLLRGMDWFAVTEAKAIEAVVSAIALVKAGKHARPAKLIAEERQAKRQAELRRICEEMNQAVAKMTPEEVEAAVAQMRAHQF